MTRPRTEAGRQGRRRGQAGWRTALALALLATAAPVARAGAAPGGRWAAFSLLAGSAQPVAWMADYQWDVRPHAAWGAMALAGTGPFAAGLRWWRGGTTQDLGLAGATDPAVHLNSVELLARARVARWRNVQCQATASFGRLAIGYHPDHVTVDAGGTPVEVAFEPLHEWVGGAGVALAAPLANHWSWGFEMERRRFSLDTAHRSGSAVVLSREAFGDWDARASLARAWDW